MQGEGQEARGEGQQTRQVRNPPSTEATTRHPDGRGGETDDSKARGAVRDGSTQKQDRS